MISEPRHQPDHLVVELRGIAFDAACEIDKLLGNTLSAEKLAQMQVIIAKAMHGAVLLTKPAPVVS
jgi:hypothetical protein